MALDPSKWNNGDCLPSRCRREQKASPRVQDLCIICIVAERSPRTEVKECVLHSDGTHLVIARFAGVHQASHGQQLLCWRLSAHLLWLHHSRDPAVFLEAPIPGASFLPCPCQTSSSASQPSASRHRRPLLHDARQLAVGRLLDALEADDAEAPVAALATDALGEGRRLEGHGVGPGAAGPRLPSGRRERLLHGMPLQALLLGPAAARQLPLPAALRRLPRHPVCHGWRGCWPPGSCLTAHGSLNPLLQHRGGAQLVLAMGVAALWVLATSSPNKVLANFCAIQVWRRFQLLPCMRIWALSALGADPEDVEAAHLRLAEDPATAICLCAVVQPLL
mmetsp:Transcript_38047/g.109766  ORF Transcript_38047/g.109766 Transcript_38047/m.109766 type:complete len:335 (+) Transcript_38047:67-1071(+)